ncbi:MAG: hypothetical protein II901_04345 [Paludibacteraceae bacterium]|nr:hypothetical protein [Paludibacteraceae bacterium]
MKTKTIIAAIACIALVTTSCSSSRKAVAPAQPQVQTINLALVENPQADKYANLEYGIRLNVQDGRSDKRLIQVYDAAATSKPIVNVNPGIGSFVPESMRRYMRTMGFNMDADVATDYLMQITIKEFHTDWLSGIGWNGTVIMDVKIFDHNRAIVYPTTEVAGRASIYGSAQSISYAQQAINKAYAAALADIDWDRVAYFLHRANSPKQEGNKKVSGEGNTALEHLIVHWEIDSRPHGADVQWRVVSSTNEVKNQNWKYLGTTPYEGTKALDIEGLTYNNSGNVRIQISVSKAGYGKQTRDYDLRSVIDEKEVSGFIQLYKED